VNTFVEECRREWSRLGVPDLLADEMAGDLAADLAEAQSEGIPASEILGQSDPRRFAAAWASERGLVTEHPPKRSRNRARLLFASGLVILLAAGVVIPVALTGTGAGHGPTTFTPSGPVSFEHTPALVAMHSVFVRPSAGPIPAGVAREVASLVKGAPARASDWPRGVLVEQGRLLLSNLGPKRDAIYVFPTRNKQVCVVITHLSAGCKKAFILGQPASVDGGSFYFPTESGPPAELAGTTEDGVTGVSVVLNGKPQRAVFGRNAWYYRFPNNHTPATAATELLVTLSSGATTTIPLPNEGPPG
jgi:hypothetical protein